jgi:hypothetical protein
MVIQNNDPDFGKQYISFLMMMYVRVRCGMWFQRLLERNKASQPVSLINRMHLIYDCGLALLAQST